MGKDEPQDLTPASGLCPRRRVLTGSHLWPLGVQEAVLIGRLEMEDSCHSSDATEGLWV